MMGMRFVWWVVIGVGMALVGVGTYTAVASQAAIDYIKSCSVVTASCTPGGDAGPRFFLIPFLTAFLQEAELVHLSSIVVTGVGLGCVLYGVYLHPPVRGRQVKAR